MRKILPLVLVAAGATALFAWTVANRDGNGDNGSPLAYAPADTPYAVGFIEPLPEAIVRDWSARLDPAVPLYTAQLRSVADMLGGIDGAPPIAGRLADALADEIEGRSFEQVMAGMGLSIHSRSAIYGMGLVPVARIELHDVDAFRGFVARLEQKAGEALPVATTGAQEYWQLVLPDAPVVGVAAIVGKHLVLSMAPVDPSEETLQALLGVRAPDPSLLGSDALEALVERYAYQRNMLGFFDTGRFIAAITSEPTPLEQSFLAALETEKPPVSEACRAELEQLALSWPGASFGYTTLDARHMDMRAVLETAPEIAADLMTLRAPMPAMGAIPDDSLFNFGFSLNLDAVPTLVNKRAAAIASQPYQCEWMGWLNTGAELARGGVNNPALYATAPVLRGFQVVLEELELGPDWIPSAMRGALVVGSNNPKSLVAMAAMAVPQVAAMDIQPDGSVTPLELPAVPNMPQVPAWVSMVENALGVGFGEGADARLPQYLKGDASQQPLLVFGYSGRAYALAADFMERAVAQMEALEAAAAGNAAADGGADDAADGADAADAAALADADADADADAHADADVDADDASDIAARELVRRDLQMQAQMLRVYAGWIERAELRIEFTEHGIEMLQQMRSRD